MTKSLDIIALGLLVVVVGLVLLKIIIARNEPKITIEDGRTWIHMKKGDK